MLGSDGVRSDGVRSDTLRAWFHRPAGEEVIHCIVANILRHCAKLEIPGEKREERWEERERREKGGGREGWRQEGGKVRRGREEVRRGR